MKIKALLLGAAASLALAGTANAGFERDGWYFGLEGGAVMVNETQMGTSRIEFDHGYGVLGTMGYAFKNSNWRMEGEVGYRENDGTQTIPCLQVCALGEVRLKEWTGMVNAVYDIKMGSDKWGLAVGAGIGIDNPRYNAPDGTDSNDKVFAAQALAGFTYRVNQHWDLVLNYRYLWVGGAELQASVSPVTREMDLEKHTVTVGFRYGYDDPPPPPPPVAEAPPAPPVARTYIVFFGFNKCNNTAEADAVLSEAASAAKSTGSASVRVVGHTDTSGSNAYNQKLSECRANAVKSNLTGKGVSEGSISTSGKGETELMVQTGDRVKEPQNRRATVDLN